MGEQVISLGVLDPVSERGWGFVDMKTSVGKKSNIVRIIQFLFVKFMAWIATQHVGNMIKISFLTLNLE